MKKISALVAFTAAGLMLATPAHADDTDPSRINIAGYRNLTTANLCKQALALVPVAAPWTGEVDAACNDRDHVDDELG
jgi:hypothetical protein